jgi:hypothetical protein
MCGTLGVRPTDACDRRGSAVGPLGLRRRREQPMKRLVVPALAFGLAIVLANAAWAGLFDEPSQPGGCCEPCKPKCSKPKCCKPRCPKPCCKPACPKPACNSCDPCHSHGLSRLKGWMKGRGCDSCSGGAPTAGEIQGGQGHAGFDGNLEQRLVPVPSGTSTSMRTSRPFLTQ